MSNTTDASKDKIEIHIEDDPEKWGSKMTEIGLIQTQEEWWKHCMGKGTSGSQVFDILGDWKKERTFLLKEIERLKKEIKKAIFEIHDKDHYWEGMKILGDLVGIRFPLMETEVLPTTVRKIEKEAK